MNPRGERYLMISQEALAHLAGISRQRCNESLAGMQSAGLVQIDYEAVRVLDLQALWRLAAPDSNSDMMRRNIENEKSA